ncbi:MAG TPA: hypothetical protein V6D26_07180 [Stenomitos sp.]
MHRVTLEKAIPVISNAPDIVVEKFHGVFLPPNESGDDGKLLAQFREKYRSIGYWLRYFLAHHHHLNFELLNTRKQLCKPFAEILVNYFSLAQQLNSHPKSSRYIARYSPEYLLMVIGLQHCSEDLTNSGYLDQPNPQGKESSYELSRKHYNSLRSKRGLPFAQSEGEIVGVIPPKEFLEGLGAWLASIDIDFRNGYFEEYKRSQKRCYRQIKCNPQLKAAYLDGLQLKLVARGGKRPKSTKIKQDPGS